MKILIVSNSDVISGAEIVLKDYIESSKHSFSLLTTNISSNINFFGDIKGIVDIFLYKHRKEHKNFISRKLSFVIQLIREGIALHRTVSQNDFGLVYCNNTASIFAASFLKKVGILKLPLVNHIHDQMSGSSFKHLVRILGKNIPTIANSYSCKKDLIEISRLDKNDITVIYNGIDREIFNISKRHEDKDVTIGFAGSIIPRKGLHLLADAYKQIFPYHENLTLSIAYNFYEEEYYNKIIAVLEGTNYRINKLERSEMSNFYSECDIFVVPSLKDPLPTTVLEAMAAGCIVIGSNVDGIPEMLSNDYLFSVSDEKCIVSKLKDIMNNIDSYKDTALKTNIEVIDKKFTKRKKQEIMDGFFLSQTGRLR